ncbi:MAG: hypothetical protein L0Y71_24230 [Gemmataceae bacterium]|nr:hypothetical protein [Gemmataceae bacterium]
MPHASFLELLCPWPGCGFQIWFIDFRLEFVDRALYDQGVAAWESGAGLIGRCPGCGRRVLFNLNGKFRVDGDGDPAGPQER